MCRPTYNLSITRGFIISLAIASETMIRHLTRKFLSDPVNLKYESIVNTIPVLRIIDNWYKIGFDSKSWKNLRKYKNMVKKVFELRNSIMHKGESPKINKTKQKEFSAAVRGFLLHGEAQIKKQQY